MVFFETSLTNSRHKQIEPTQTCSERDDLAMPMMDWSDYQQGRNKVDPKDPEAVKAHAEYVREDMLHRWRIRVGKGAHDLTPEQQEIFGKLAEDISPYFNAFKQDY